MLMCFSKRLSKHIHMWLYDTCACAWNGTGWTVLGQQRQKFTGLVLGWSWLVRASRGNTFATWYWASMGTNVWAWYQLARACKGNILAKRYLACPGKMVPGQCYLVWATTRLVCAYLLGTFDHKVMCVLHQKMSTVVMISILFSLPA